MKSSASIHKCWIDQSTLRVPFMFLLCYVSPMRTIRDRFPPPWTVETIPGGYVVVSGNGVRLVFVYVSPHTSEGGLTAGEARAIAYAVAGLSR